MSGSSFKGQQQSYFALRFHSSDVLDSQDEHRGIEGVIPDMLHNGCDCMAALAYVPGLTMQ